MPALIPIPQTRKKIIQDPNEDCPDCEGHLVIDVENDGTGHIFTIATCPKCGYTEST